MSAAELPEEELQERPELRLVLPVGDFCPAFCPVHGGYPWRRGAREAEVARAYLEEVKALRDRPAGLSRTARQALGYRELLAHLDGELDLDAAVDLAVRRTRRFARRQRVWFRRDPRIRWLTTDTDPMAVLGALLDIVDEPPD